VTFTENTAGAAASAVTKKEALALVSLARLAAEAAAAVIRDATPRRATLNWQEKGVADFVTEVDVKAQATAIGILAAAEPSAGFIAEESGLSATQTPDSRIVFVIDPLDGTTNFLHGLPEYAVSIGVMAAGALVAGVVLNVPRGELFWGAAGAHAWLGEQRLRVSAITNPQRALIGTGFPFKTPAEIPGYLPQIARVMAGTSGVRRPGAASIDLAHVAAGRLDGFWENTLAPWDVAAGILLIREAGGVCTDPDGKESAVASGPIVAGNATIHSWLINALKPC
jgi:myo-inositol-1(or 4)-monophosphatase